MLVENLGVMQLKPSKFPKTAHFPQKKKKTHTHTHSYHPRAQTCTCEGLATGLSSSKKNLGEPVGFHSCAYNTHEAYSREEETGLEETAAHISETERRSVAAERDTAARYMAVSFSKRIGERQDGRITGVSRSGLFIRPHASAADGFAPVARLPGGITASNPRNSPWSGIPAGKPIASVIRRVEVAEANPLTIGLILDVLPGKL